MKVSLWQLIGDFSLFVLFSSCASFSDTSEDLGNGYEYMRESSTITAIYKHFDTGMFEIRPTVVDYTISGDYLVCSQVKLDSISLVTWNKLPEDALKRKVYWVINTKNDLIQGPLDSVAYRQVIRKLGI